MFQTQERKAQFPQGTFRDIYYTKPSDREPLKMVIHTMSIEESFIGLKLSTQKRDVCLCKSVTFIHGCADCVLKYMYTGSLYIYIYIYIYIIYIYIYIYMWNSEKFLADQES